MKVTVRAANAAMVLALLGSAASCRPDLPPPGPTPIAPSPEFITGNLEPMIVDWQPEQRGDLEVSMRDGLVVVGYDKQGFRLLRDCHVDGTYGFMGMTRRERVVRLESADDLRANLPLGGIGLAAKLGGELEKGATLDIAMVMIGKLRTTWRSVGSEDLVGQCAGATHVVRGATVGAFAVDKGDRTRMRAVAEIFGAGMGGGMASSSMIRTVDGQLADCSSAAPDSPTAPKQCGALIRVELLPIAATKDVTLTAARARDPELADVCPSGLVMVEGKCTRAQASLASKDIECTYGNGRQCLDQCKAGNAKSCAKLSLMVVKGEGAPQSAEQGPPLAMMACKRGDAAGCTLLGNYLEHGVGTQKNHKEAAESYAKGCDAGDAEGCQWVGTMLLIGMGVPRDTKLAAQALSKGCKGGAHGACSDLGLLALGGQGFDKDLPTATGLFKRACDGDNGTGCSNLGYMLEFGAGTPKNLQASLQAYLKACKLDDTTCTQLGAMFHVGKGVARDDAKAVALYKTACAKGDTVGCALVRGYIDPSQTFDVARANGEMNVWKATCENGIARDCTGIGLIAVSVGRRDEGRQLLEKGCTLGDEWGCVMAKLSPRL
ncbi:MAG: sel1 repeat family protein [Labilithrix sp.]|nr:sel1 repeat family protein [Labilithrix sp.]